MALYLVQHGKSLPKDKDPNKDLSEEGVSQVTRIAQVAKGYGIHISCIKHSKKERARKTAEIFDAVVGTEKGIEEISGIAPLDDVTAFSSNVTPDDNVMVVGHLPFMEKLTSYLITGSQNNPVFKFQNGGIVCLDKHPDTGTWIIKWALMPNIS